MTKKDFAASLEQFAAADTTRPGLVSLMDQLPEEVRDLILSSEVGHSGIARWLKSEGFEGINQGMVGRWRRDNGWQS